MAEPANEFVVLLGQARQGDRAAAQELARKYEPEVRILARVLLGPALRPHLDSMDLVQSVHRSLLVGLRAGRFHISSPDRLIALALTMVRRKVSRQWQHLRRQQRLTDAAAPAADPLELLASLSRPSVDPASLAQYHDAVRQLWDELSASERRLIELRLEGYTTSEAARALSVDARVLRVQLSRLRQRLHDRRLLHDWL
jgi:RNA polymerase sigma factor (sigma-70 family)